LAKLEAILEKDDTTVFGLEEVSLAWYPKFKVFFQNHGYDFLCTNYGSEHSNYMGVALAFPTKKFEIVDGEIFRASESVKFKRVWEKRDDPSARKRCWDIATSSLLALSAGALVFDQVVKSSQKNKKCNKMIKAAVTTGLLASLGITLARTFGLVDKAPKKRKQTALSHAKGRYNRQIIVTLRDKSTKRDLVVSVYHMPCVFWFQPVMVIHASLCASAVVKYVRFSLYTICHVLSQTHTHTHTTHRYAKARNIDSYVLCGDFNFDPKSSSYRMITQGKIEDTDADYPKLPRKEKWTPNKDLVKFNSAYVSLHSFFLLSFTT